MNYNDWVRTLENRTPGHLAGIVSAIDTLEKDVDIKREFGDLGLFAGFSLKNAAREALGKKKEQVAMTVAQRVYTMTVARIVAEYPQVNPAVITCPVTFRKVLEWIKGIKTDNSILDVAGAIIDTVIDDIHIYYHDLKSKFIKEADLDPDADESECSILYGDSYYSLEDSIREMLTVFFESGALMGANDGNESATLTTSFFWDCECKDNFIHPNSKRVCFDCNSVASDQPDSRVSEVVCAKLKGDI